MHYTNAEHFSYPWDTLTKETGKALPAPSWCPNEQTSILAITRTSNDKGLPCERDPVPIFSFSQKTEPETRFRYKVEISDCFDDLISHLLIDNHLHNRYFQRQLWVDLSNRDSHIDATQLCSTHRISSRYSVVPSTWKNITLQSDCWERFLRAGDRGDGEKFYNFDIPGL